jgi:hypothetical protein
MAGIRLAPIVDQSCLLVVAGRDGSSLRIAAHCVAEYVNGLYSPMERTRRSAAPALGSLERQHLGGGLAADDPQLSIVP